MTPCKRSAHRQLQAQNGLLTMTLTLAFLLAWNPIMHVPLVHLGAAARMPGETMVSAMQGISRTVATPQGNIKGRACLLNGDVTEYLGIPFAQPPVGDLRFSPPAKYSSQYPSPALQATRNPPACGSFCGAIGSLEFQAVNSSEDCLYLNLWTPANAAKTGGKLPVRVYIHGGHDLECSASDPYLNGCTYVAKTASIIVNIQYRKGPFGFLAHPATLAETNTTGNWAILDQQLALKWVQENIAYFGGDPSRVLLNGNSAGGQYVDLQVVSPLSAGLFSSAISQSPPCVKLATLEEAYNVTKQFLTDLGCSSTSEPTDEIACLRQQSWSTMFNAAAVLNLAGGLSYAQCESLSWKPYFQAVLDGTVFPYAVEKALELGAFQQVPYMVGFATKEGTHFMDQETVTNSTFTQMAAAAFPFVDLEPLRALYPDSNYVDESDPEKARVSDLWTDLYFTCPIYNRLVKRLSSAGTADTYLYEWDVTPSCPPESVYLGASHGTEILFTYGIVSQINPPWGTCDLNTAEVEISNILLTAWTSMNTLGVPQWTNGSAWLQWTPEAQLGTKLASGATRSAVIDLESKCRVVEETRNRALLGMGLLTTS